MNNIMALVRYSMRPSGLKLCTARIQWVSDSTFVTIRHWIRVAIRERVSEEQVDQIIVTPSRSHFFLIRKKFSIRG